MSVKQSAAVSYSVRAAVALALGTASVLGSVPRAVAADEGAAAKLEEITITGSRIKRPELESTSPLVTVDAEQLETRSGLNIESYLNQLPNYNPAVTPTTGAGDVQATSINTVGISTIALRGFGANRSLVLVDGHRTTPVNALMITDINSIPAAMIDRIEIISGGASAVYGADAIGGVTNFILKKHFQGLQIDAQDSITQAGDGNELRVTALMGTKIDEGRGNIIMGTEFYDRRAAYQRSRSFYTKAWNDPNVIGSDLFVFGLNGYNTFFSPPSNAALNAVFPSRGTIASPNVFAYPGSGFVSGLRFNANGTLADLIGPLGTSGYTGPTSGNGYGIVNTFDTTQLNTAGTAANPGTAPNVVQQVKWNNTDAFVSEPQTRYSFFANGAFDITDKIQFYTNARFAQSKTSTILFPANASYGWEATVPYNANTDSPICLAGQANTACAAATTPAAYATLFPAMAANPAAYANPNFINTGTKGAQHPVPYQLAILLNSRTTQGSLIQCDPFVSASLSVNCTGGPQASASWVAETYPINSFASRATDDTSTEWTIESGLKFPIVGDWTGEAYYSRGQSTAYNLASGDDSLQRWRAMVQSPDYGRNVTIQGNANGANVGFGTSVPTKCTSGYYNTLFAADARPSQNCLDAVTATLQTQTQLQQDVVEANFAGSLFKLPAGDVSAAFGYQYRRDAGQFYPDGLQSTNSFLDQVIGVYPTAALDAQTSVKDYYGELFVPIVSNLGFVRNFNLDFGGRYSNYSETSNTTTFKVTADAQLGRSIHLRGGFNRASRAPNLGELFLNMQEYFGGGAAFGDPCSVRSRAPFGAGGAGLDYSTSGSSAGSQTALAGGQTAAGAQSAYLICQAMMGGGGSAYYYGSAAARGNTNQGTAANAAVFAWLNQIGNSNLRSETANTWTGGIVFSSLGDSPLISGLSAAIDWWKIDINNAIQLDSPDYANYLCYGTVQVSTAAAAAAQAATPACQNVTRSLSTGGQNVATLQYTNQATISESGIDLNLNWFVQLNDLGIKLPGGISFNSQDSVLNYFRTKTSPASFDVVTDWKGSLGPTLAGTNPGSYSYRLFTSLSYVLPSFNFNLRWRFYPSVNPAARATQNAIIKSNQANLASGNGPVLSWTPTTVLAAPAYSVFDASLSWTLNKVVQLRAGVDNLLNKAPAITGATAGYPGGNLTTVCSAAMVTLGCVNPTAFALPSDGQGITSSGFYDVYGRRFYLGFTASF